MCVGVSVVRAHAFMLETFLSLAARVFCTELIQRVNGYVAASYTQYEQARVYKATASVVS